MQTHRFTLSINLPRIHIATRKGTILIDGRTLTLTGAWTPAEAERIRTSIEDNFWEYQVPEASPSLAARVANYYMNQGKLAYLLVERGRVRVEEHHGVVRIIIPPDERNHAGRLIGRDGSLVKGLEQTLGKRVKIITEETETEKLKRKLDQLLKKLTE